MSWLADNSWHTPLRNVAAITTIIGITTIRRLRKAAKLRKDAE